MSLASTFGIAQLALNFAHPVFIIAVRMIAAGIILLLINQISGGTLRGSWAHRWLFAQLSFFHIYCAFIPEFWALKYLSGAKVCLMYSFSPCVTALLEYVLYAKRLTKNQLRGMLVGFLGLFFMITMPRDWYQFTTYAWFGLPDLALLLSVVSASYGWILLKRLTLQYDYSLTQANGISMLVAGIAALITTMCIPGAFGITSIHTSDTGIWLFFADLIGSRGANILMFGAYIALLILIANVVFYNAYGYLMRFYSPTFLSFAGFTAPLFAAFYDWLLFGTIPSFSFFMAIIAIFYGLYLFYQDEIVSA